MPYGVELGDYHLNVNTIYLTVRVGVTAAARGLPQRCLDLGPH